MTAILENLAAEHQIVLRQCGNDITLSCTCAVWRSGHGGRPRHEVIEVRYSFPAGEAIAAWRAWHAAQGVIV
jgi:hypothetical protein